MLFCQNYDSYMAPEFYNISPDLRFEYSGRTPIICVILPVVHSTRVLWYETGLTVEIV